jgi:hypothetical protein
LTYFQTWLFPFVEDVQERACSECCKHTYFVWLLMISFN